MMDRTRMERISSSTRLSTSLSGLRAGLIPVVAAAAILCAGTLTTSFAQDVDVEHQVTTGNNLGLALQNDGFIGNNLASREPSMEYPLGSDIEHLVRAGVWIGAVVASTGDTLVSTAATAGYAGSLDAASEYVPTSEIRQLSTLPFSRYFSPDARSEQDFVYSFADSVRPVDNTEDAHEPMNIQVTTTTSLFSFEPFDAFVLMDFTVENINPFELLSDVYVGVYAEMATGYKTPDDPNWRSGWFGQKDITWVDSLRICTEHHFNDDNGDAPAWAGYQLLGVRDGDGNAIDFAQDSLVVSFNWWNWRDETDRIGDAPVDDIGRYRTLSNGAKRSTAGSEAGNNDPVTLISIGPIPLLAPGEKFTVSFAWVGGEADPRTGRTTNEDLLFNASWAQTAFDLNLNIPLPPPSPRLKVIPDLGRLTLRWTDDPEDFIDPESGRKDFEGYRVHMSESRLESEFQPILEADVIDSVFYNTGIESLRDPITIDGVDYEYRYDVTGLRDGFKYWAAVTAFDTGTQEIESLSSGLAQNRTFAFSGSPVAESPNDVLVFPNPYRGDAAWDGALGRDRYLWFANLPARCTIRIYTLAGDLVDTIEFDSDSYTPTDIRGIYDPTDRTNPEADLPRLPGGMAAWDLVTRQDQGVASGLYLFYVEDHATGDKQNGKFLILK